MIVGVADVAAYVDGAVPCSKTTHAQRAVISLYNAKPCDDLGREELPFHYPELLSKASVGSMGERGEGITSPRRLPKK